MGLPTPTRRGMRELPGHKQLAGAMVYQGLRDFRKAVFAGEVRKAREIKEWLVAERNVYTQILRIDEDFLAEAVRNIEEGL